MSNTSFPRAVRNAVRAAVSEHPGWPEWRAANCPLTSTGKPKDVSQLLTVELAAAAAALAIDVSALTANATPETDDEKETDDMPATATENVSFEGHDVAELVRHALAPAEGMVGAKLLDMLAATVMPLATAAAQGPRTVVQTRTVTVKAADGQVLPPLREVQMKGREKAKAVFNLKAVSASHFSDVLAGDVSTWDGTADDGVPDRDPHHIWDMEALAYLTLAARFADEGSKLRNMSRVLFYGPAGTGKTSTAAQFAAATGRPFVRIAFDRTTEPAELIGQRMPKAGGGTEFVEGALVTAMQVPGCVILLDEPSFLRPGAAAVMQTIMDMGAVFLKEDGNRRVELAPGVVIVAADNTNLTGDPTGRHADTMAQNVALQDRFGYLVAMDYLPEAQEAGVLSARTGIAADAARAMVAFAATTRRNASTGALTTGTSLRRLVAWATGCMAGVPSSHAFKAAITNACDPSDLEVVRGLEKNMVDHTALDRAVQGLPPLAAAPDMSAKAAAAAKVFGAAPVTA